MAELFFNLDVLFDRGLQDSVSKPLAKPFEANSSNSFYQALTQQSRSQAAQVKPSPLPQLPPLYLNHRLSGFVSRPAGFRPANTAAYQRPYFQAAVQTPKSSAKSFLQGQVSFSSAQPSQKAASLVFQFSSLSLPKMSVSAPATTQEGAQSERGIFAEIASALGFGDDVQVTQLADTPVLAQWDLLQQLQGPLRIRTLNIEFFSDTSANGPQLSADQPQDLTEGLAVFLPLLLNELPAAPADFVEPDFSAAAQSADKQLALEKPLSDSSIYKNENFFPVFFPLPVSPEAAQPSPASELDFSPAFDGLGSLAPAKPAPVFSFSFVQVQQVETLAVPSRPVLVPLAFEPRPLDSWRQTFYEAMGFVSELFDLSELLPHLTQAASEPEAHSSDFVAAFVTSPEAEPVFSPESDLLVEPSFVSEQTEAAQAAPVIVNAAAPQTTEQPARQRPETQNKAPQPEEVQAQSLLPELDFEQPLSLSLKDLVQLPADVIQGLDLSLFLAMPQDDPSVWPEDQAFWDELFATQSFNLRPDVPAGEQGNTAQSVESPSPFMLPLMTLLGIRPLSPGRPESAQESSQPAEQPPADALLPVQAAAETGQQSSAGSQHSDTQESDSPEIPVVVQQPVIPTPFVVPEAVQPVESLQPQPAGAQQPVPTPQQPVVSESVLALGHTQAERAQLERAQPAPAAVSPLPQSVPVQPEAEAALPVVPVATLPAGASEPVEELIAEAPVKPGSNSAPVAPALVPEAPVPFVPVQTASSEPPESPVMQPQQPVFVLQLLSLPQGRLEVQPEEDMLPRRPLPRLPRLQLLALKVGQLQLRPLLRQAEPQAVYGQLSLDAQLLATELQPAAELAADLDQSNNQSQNSGQSASDSWAQQPVASVPQPQPLEAVPFEFKLDDLLGAPAPKLQLTLVVSAPRPQVLSAGNASQPSRADFTNYLTHEARQVFEQVESFIVTLAAPAKAASERPAARPLAEVSAEPVQSSEPHSSQVTVPAAGPLSASQVIQAVNHNVPIHISNFPAFVNQVVQTMDPGSQVVQSIEVSMRPSDLGQVTAQFGLTNQNKVVITLYTQSTMTAQVLESCQQEIQQIVNQTQFSLGQMVVKQAVPPTRQGMSNQNGSSGNSQQGTGGADYSSRQFRRNNKRRRDNDNLSIDVTV